MADKKISQLSEVSTPLVGTEVLPIVQSGDTKKVATDDLTVKNVRSNATTGILQIAGPAASSTRVMTVPNANFTAARTDAGQTFTGNQVITGTLLVNTTTSIASTAIEVKGNVTGYSKTGTVTTTGQVGQAYTTATTNGQTFTFSTASAKLFTIATGGGAGVLIFADYKSTTITLVGNPSSEFEASSTPTAGKTGIYKSANSHVISVYNNTGGAVNYNILTVGPTTATTDPV